tara:strand:- start:4269 stop:4991 length:723 start_codon:yes stop_codon:yes gene_type:complete
MAQAQFVNPLAGLQSKAPVQDNSALRKLQTSLAVQNLANQGSMANTKQSGLDSQLNTSMQYGGIPKSIIPNLDSNSLAAIKLYHGVNNAKTAATALSTGADAGIGPQKGAKPNTLVGTALGNLSSGNALPKVLAAAAGNNKTVLSNEATDKVVQKYLGNVPVAASTRTSTTQQGSKSTAKGDKAAPKVNADLAAAEDRRVLGIVQQKFPSAGITSVRKDNKGNYMVLDGSGQWQPLNRTK